MATQARERLMQTAEDLFYAEGIQAVGVERLVEVSGVGRASFYRHFTSKESLVHTVLRERDRKWRALLAEGVSAREGHPLAVFDFLAERFSKADFRGCAFINAMAELGATDAEVRRMARAHKQAVTDYLDQLLADAGYLDHGVLASQLMLLVDGALVTALRERSAMPAQQAKSIATILLAGDRPS